MKLYCKYCKDKTRHELEGVDKTWACQNCVEDVGSEESWSESIDDSYESFFVDDVKIK